MAIYAPGRRNRHNRPFRSAKRSAIMILSLTAMVDMFTVLAVFLLQNYQTTGEAIELSEEVKLPKASAVKELKPAHVVVVAKGRIMLDKDMIADFTAVKEQKDWKIDNLFNLLQQRFKESEEKRGALNAVKTAVEDAKGQATDPQQDRRITIQADKTIDFLTIKKIMYTLTEAGASEVNFAVLKDDKNAQN